MTAHPDRGDRYSSPGEPTRHLLELLADQEVLHQRVLADLFANTDLASRLGIWSGSHPPSVLSEPFRGLFDLALLDAPGGSARVVIELKAFSELGHGQFDRQREAAGQMNRVYVLLGPSYFQWRRAEGVMVIGLPEMAKSVREVAAASGGVLSGVAGAYADLLEAEAVTWSRPLDPAGRWSTLEFFRFYDEIAATWPPAARIYSATNPGGPDWILHPWRWPSIDRAGWEKALFYWEIVHARLRFKIEWRGDRAAGVQARDEYTRALLASGRSLGEDVHTVRARAGTFMTGAELDGDIRRLLVRDGIVDGELARALYERGNAVFDAALEVLRRG